MTTNVTLPHDGAWSSVAKDGDVMIVTDMVGMEKDVEVIVLTDHENSRLKLVQNGKVFVDAPVESTERLVEIDAAGKLVVTETSEGADRGGDGFVVHRLVRRG